MWSGMLVGVGAIEALILVTPVVHGSGFVNRTSPLVLCWTKCGWFHRTKTSRFFQMPSFPQLNEDVAEYCFFSNLVGVSRPVE